MVRPRNNLRKKMNKHLTRIKTGLLLGIFSIVSIFFFPDKLFAALCAILISFAFWEWLVLLNIKNVVHKLITFVLFWVLVVFMNHHLRATLNVSLVWWIMATLLIFVPLDQLKWLKNKMLQFIIASLILGALFIAAVKLHEVDRTILFYLIMLVCFADTAAYFVGTKYGQHKLLERVSPKKSIEGMAGGLIVGSIAGLSVVLFMPGLSVPMFLGWFIFGVFLIFVSVIGDLFESLMKRLFDAKDSGSILPGHGGFLDRLDSLAAAFPIYLLFLYVFHII